METEQARSAAHAFLVFWKASRSIQKYDQDSISAAGFDSLTDFAVLEVLLHKGSLPVNTIGEKVLLTSGSITTAIQRLEKKGWVYRERSQHDARVVLVHLTDVGREQIERAFSTHSENLNQLFSVFSDEERDLFTTLVRKLGKHAHKLNQ